MSENTLCAGGVLFALEELTSWWRARVLWHAFATTAVVSVALRAALKWCSKGHCGWFGKMHGVLVFNMTDGQDDYEIYELLPMLLLGAPLSQSAAVGTCCGHL